MWLGVHIYNDGMEPTFKKAKTKKEITEWLINECDFGSAERNNIWNQGDGISYEMWDMDLNTAWIINLNAQKGESGFLKRIEF